ncbi:MAG: DNA repair protein RecN [bacterium]|nr:DNA repair protein RecN [bacterium]
MIQTLRVRNLATIEELDLELGDGLNVLTGETGAGKSVLFGAIGMLSGRRVSSEVVRTGAAEARVEAVFDAVALLERARELGLAGDEDDQLLVARSVSREGRGKVHVNGRLATVAMLSDLLGDALEIVGQGEHQRLLRPEVQAELLDGYGELEAPAAEVRELYARWRVIAIELQERRARAAELARREDQLRFEIEQIDQLDPQPGELAALDEELARLGHVDRLGQASASASSALEADDGARARIGAARAALRQVSELDRSLGEIIDGLQRAALELEESVGALERYSASLESDPARLARVEDRLAELRRLQTRYGPDEVAILAYRDNARAELDAIGGGEARNAELEAEQAELAEQIDASARNLTRLRRAVGDDLEKKIGKELKALDLQRAHFGVALEVVSAKTPDGLEAPSGPGGRERACFMLAANPGEEPKRLRDAASGGELSRLLLALRNVLRDADRERVLLFDEIDAGLGGATASRVGERLRALASRHQIVSITHLPQVAALGSTHFRVVKQVRGKRTLTGVETLQGSERVDEIARMAGDGKLSKVARAHARELLAQA